MNHDPRLTLKPSHVRSELALPVAVGLEYEQRLWRLGYSLIAGIDEAGRGCLAGPVVAAAVIFPEDAQVPGVRDSKKLSAGNRGRLETKIRAGATAIGVGTCSPEEIDELNILWASMEAMRRAVEALSADPNFLLIDGNRCFPRCRWPHETLVKGDDRSHSIAAASIIAKTHRDRLMVDLDREHPVYKWASNKGYPTRDHYRALAKHGPTRHHRRSFRLQ